MGVSRSRSAPTTPRPQPPTTTPEGGTLPSAARACGSRMRVPPPGARRPASSPRLRAPRGRARARRSRCRGSTRCRVVAQRPVAGRVGRHGAQAEARGELGRHEPPRDERCSGRWFRTIHGAASAGGRVDMRLHLDEGDGALGERAVAPLDAVAGVLSALIRETVTVLVDVFQQAVAVAAVGCRESSRPSSGRRPQPSNCCWG